MTTQTDLTLSPAALGAAVLGIAPESTAGKVLSARPKANRLTAAKYKQLAEFLTQFNYAVNAGTSRHLSKVASSALRFTVTENHVFFVRTEMLGLKPAAKVKPLVQDHLCVSARAIEQLRADVGAIAFALYSQYPGTMNELRAIAEGNAK